MHTIKIRTMVGRIAAENAEFCVCAFWKKFVSFGDIFFRYFRIFTASLYVLGYS